MPCGRLSDMTDSSVRRFSDQPPSRRQVASLLLPRDKSNSAAWLHTSHENGRRIGGNCVEAVRQTRFGRCTRGEFEESLNAGGLVSVLDFSLDAKTNQSLGEDGRMVRSDYKYYVCRINKGREHLSISTLLVANANDSNVSVLLRTAHQDSLIDMNNDPDAMRTLATP